MSGWDSASPLTNEKASWNLSKRLYSCFYVGRSATEVVVTLSEPSLTCSLYLCNLRSNMCNRSFQPGLHPSFATLFSTSSRTIVASSLQKEGPFGSNNRLKPCCNLGSSSVANPVSNPVANKKTPRLTLGVCILGLEPWSSATVPLRPPVPTCAIVRSTLV